MSTKPNPQQPEENNSSNNIEQNDTGDAKLEIGANHGTAINKIGRDVNFNGTSIVQISVDVIHTRKFISTSPYKSLNKFETTDKDLFFGRDQFLLDLASELEETSFILLLGASGSGKSSVIRAGLIPSLQQKQGSMFVNLTFTPDENPFESLHGSLLSKNSHKQAQIAREVKADTLIQVVKKLKQSDSYWFIFIDQFEELFTTTPEDKATVFINGLLKIASTKIANIKIVATMRADFLDKLSPYPKLVKATKNHRPMIAEMQPDELRMAIEQPAARHGVVFETGLVDEIIKDVQGQAGYLPLLQYTLNILWEEEVKSGSINDRTLNISSYRDLGGVRGALQKRVDSIYGEFNDEQRLATQKIFLKLVGIGGNLESETEWKPIRRRELRSEFETELEQSVLVKLIDENLLVSDSQSLGKHQQSTVEIAHEILLTSWTTLSNWIKDNRLAIALRNRLNDDVARWKDKKADDELWGGSKLEQVLELKGNSTFNEVLGGFSADANQFIDASLKKRDREFRRAIMLAGIGLTLAGLASAGGVLALIQQQEALKQNIIGITQLAESRLLANNQLDAMVEAIKAKKKLKNVWIGKNSVSLWVLASLGQAVHHNQKGWRERLRLLGTHVIFSSKGKLMAIKNEDAVRLWDAATGQMLHKLTEHESLVNSMVFSPNDKLLATASNDNTARLWDVKTGKVLHKLTGHESSVVSVVFSPDGKLLATASYDKTPQMWDVKTGQMLHQLNEHESVVLSVIFSPNSKLLATASNDTTARLWDVKTGKVLHKLTGHESSVVSVVFSPNSKLLATASRDETVRLWDVESGKVLHKLTGHESTVESAIFSPDGKLLATASADKTARLWNVKTGKVLHKLTGHESSVVSVVFSPNSKLLATASADKTARLWDVKTGKVLHKITGHKNALTSAIFSPDGKLLATASADKTARLWDAEFGKLLHELTGHESIVESAIFSPNDKLLATASSDNTARLWDVKTSKLLHELTGHENALKSVIFSPNGKLLATASYDKTARLWDVEFGKLLYKLIGHKSLVRSVIFSSNGKLLATASYDKTARLWDVKTGKLLHELTGHENALTSAIFSPKGKLLATASLGKTALLWDVESGKVLHKLIGHKSLVRSVIFSSNGKLLATASYDKTARLWDVKTGKVLHKLTGHESTVESAIFSPNSKLLATASYDNTARLWDVKTGKVLHKLTGHESSVVSVVFSPDGKLLATVSATTVRLWDVESGKLTHQLNGHESAVLSVIFSPDGKLLATASKDKTARLWRVGDIEEMLAINCDWVRGYLQSKPEGDEDRHLCDGVGGIGR